MISGVEITDEQKDLWKKICFQKIGALVFKFNEDFKKVSSPASLGKGVAEGCRDRECGRGASGARVPLCLLRLQLGYRR